MPYRIPLLTPGTLTPDPEALQLLTDAQLARLTLWALQTGISALVLLEGARFMLEQVSDDSDRCRLIGTLPHCHLYGSLEPDGSTHT